MDGNGCSIGTHILSYKPVMEVDTLYNRPTQIAVDAENVYILPAKRQEE